MTQSDVDMVSFTTADVAKGVRHSLFKSGMIILGANEEDRSWGKSGRFVVVSVDPQTVVMRGECNEWTPAESLRQSVNWFAMYARGYGHTCHIADDGVTVTLSRAVVGPVLST